MAGAAGKDAMLGGRAALPLEAMKRRPCALEKAFGLPARLLQDILRHYARLQAFRLSSQWRWAVGVVERKTHVYGGQSIDVAPPPSTVHTVSSTPSSWGSGCFVTATSCPASTPLDVSI